MRQETSNRAIQTRGFGSAVAALAGAVALIAAGPARANNDFQNGFEDQLGRIAAYRGRQPGPPDPHRRVLPGGGAGAGRAGRVLRAELRADYGLLRPRKLVVKYPKAYRHGY